MKKADNFNASKWLVENKITFQSRLNEEEYSNERINQRDVEIAGGEVINHNFDTIDIIDLDNGYKVKVVSTYWYRDPGVKGYSENNSEENPMISGVKTTLIDPSGKPIKNHNFTGSFQWWMLTSGKEYFMPQIKAWWENKMGKLGLSESRLNEEAKDPDSAVSQEARNMFYNAVSKVMEDLRKAGIVDDDVIDSYLGTEGGLLGDAIEAALHPEDLDESKLNEDLTDEIAALPNHHTAEDTAEATLIVGKYAVVRYDESDEGGEDMYVVWDNTVNQDEIGSYDDEPEFESTEPAEVAAFLKKNS